MNLKIEYYDDGSSFQAIDPLMLNPEYLNNFSIFERFPQKGNKFRFRCLIVDMESMPVEKLASILRSWETIYLHKEHMKYYNEHIKDNLEYILKHDGIDIKKKTSIFTEVTTDVIKEVFERHLDGEVLTPSSLKRVEKHISRVIEFITDTNSLNGLADLIGHDYDTHTHSIKVSWFMATFINSNRDLFPNQSDADFKDLLIKASVAGLLHDIGKTKIPKNILNKNGKLNNLEYISIQSHTAYSVSLLFQTGLPKYALEAILYHHENEDGSGYPSSLKSEKIPLLAKIAHIADVFEALTAKRSYKEPKTTFEALRIMAGKNPHVEMLSRFEKEARENKKVPVETIVRNEPNIKIQRLREKEMAEEEAQKRVEARLKLRDQGMAHCFDKDLMKRFIITINKAKSFNLSGLL
ncbi:MAG: HD domain-containing protein [Bacteroidales bacterium]